MLPRGGIEQAPVFPEYVCNLYGERRIEIYVYGRERPLFHHHVELEEQKLGAFERERRDEQDAFACTRIFDALPQLLATLCPILVHTVAVHTLHPQIIRARGKFSVF